MMTGAHEKNGARCSSKTVRKVAVFALVAAAVLIALPSNKLPIVLAPPLVPHARAHAPALLSTSACTSNVILYMEAGLAEVVFILNTLLGSLRNACGGCLLIRTREQFVPDLRAGALDCTSAVLVARDQASAEEKAAASARASVARTRIFLLHLSDEFGDKDVSAYPLFRLVMRNYDDVGDRSADVAYLVDDEAPPARVLWAPLGHTNNALQMPLLNTPTIARRLPWSWAGDTLGKAQRVSFISGLSRSTTAPDVQSRGRLHVYETFMSKSMMLSPITYAEWLHSSRVIPCPNGGSAEQFRIWEALYAGAVPIVSAGQRHLRYLDTLGFHVLRVDSTRWGDDAVPLLYAADTNATFIDELGAMQVHNERTLVKVMSRLSHRVASEVCAAAGARCTSPGVCVPTVEAPVGATAQCSGLAHSADWAMQMGVSE